MLVGVPRKAKLHHDAQVSLNAAHNARMAVLAGGGDGDGSDDGRFPPKERMRMNIQAVRAANRNRRASDFRLP